MILPLLVALPLLSAMQTPRMIRFSGYAWEVKGGPSRMGPGPNLWDASESAVRVDRQGRLHMRISKTDRGWECSEVTLDRPLGYGTYTFEVETPTSAIDDPNIVLGLFTYGSDPAYEHREIDIELARWGQPKSPNAQYALPPYDIEGNVHRFELPLPIRGVSHSFRWTAESILFKTTGRGFSREWDYRSKTIPVPGDERASINFWLMQGKAPVTEKTYEVVIRKFSFTP